MDDLEFRRRALANPTDKSPDFLAAKKSSKQNKQYIDGLKKFENQLSNAMDIDVPDDLAERILFKHGIKQNTPSWKEYFKSEYSKPLLAIAATCVLAIGITSTLWKNQALPMGETVLSHIYAETHALVANNDLHMGQINASMRRLGVKFSNDIGVVNYLNNCIVADKVGIHMVLQGEKGPITVMLISKLSSDGLQMIQDDRFMGIVKDTPAGSLIVVGEKGEAITQTIANLSDSLILI